MKQTMKRLVTFCLAVVMVFTLLPATAAEAATKTEKITLYVGESIYATNYSDVTKVTSSNKKVVAVGRDKEYTYRANMTAKKPGTSMITIKTKRGTMKYKVTVKKLAFDVKLTELSDGEVLVSVKNNTNHIFDYVEVTYTLKGADGAVLEEDKRMVYDLLPGKTSYDKIFYSTYDFTIAIKKCSAKISSVYRSPEAKYVDRASKLTITDKGNMKTNPGYATLTLKLKNKISSSMSGSVYILLYDKKDRLIGVRTLSVFLKGSAVETETEKIDTTYSYPSYDHYKIVKNVYTKDYL